MRKASMHSFMLFCISVAAGMSLLLSSVAAQVPSGQKKRVPVYVGSDACRPCHETEYGSFMAYAKKATSFRSIERVKKGLTKEELKGCYFCHTTGYGKPGGFLSEQETPHLKNAGCEVCHGPGEFHIRSPKNSPVKKNLTTEDCEVCHTSERINAFRYKPLIHGGAH
jgi:hypothetical protein